MEGSFFNKRFSPVCFGSTNILLGLPGCSCSTFPNMQHISPKSTVGFNHLSLLLQHYNLCLPAPAMLA